MKLPNNGVDKAAFMANVIDQWRQHYVTATEAIRATSIRPKKESRAQRKEREKNAAFVRERRQSAIACMAATLLIHDRAVIEVTERRKKIREDFERAGMIPEGHKLAFIGDRPIAIPLDIPLVFKSPFGNAIVSGV